jgi:hypothetical protein
MRASKADPSMSLLERVERRLLPPDENGCRIFDGALQSGGYGMVRKGGVNYYAHRVMYEAKVGPVPDGLHLDHVYDRGCRSKACCSVEHLEPITPFENVYGRAMYPNGKLMSTHCLHGHEWTDENTYLRPDGKGRQCRTCIRRRSRRSS